MIFLIASTYNKNGFQGADGTAQMIKNDGIDIVVINYASSNGVLTNELEVIASGVMFERLMYA